MSHNYKLQHQQPIIMPLRINVTSAGGAADVTISVFYQVGQQHGA